MINDDELLLAEKIAKKISKSWTLVLFDDIFSELKLWLYSNINIVIECRDGGKFDRKYLSTSLYNCGIKYCTKESQKVGNYDINTFNFYTEKRLSDILTQLYKTNMSKLELESDSNSAAYNITKDVENALNSLDDNTKGIIEDKFKYDLTGEQFAEKYNTNVANGYQIIHRAIKRLRWRLSGEPSFWTKDSWYK